MRDKTNNNKQHKNVGKNTVLNK